MLDTKWLQNNVNEVKQQLKNRKCDLGFIDKLLEIIEQRKNLIIATEGKKQERNEVNEQLKRSSKEEIEAKREAMRLLSDEIKTLDKELSIIEEEFNDLSLRIPNMAQKEVPVGISSDENKIISYTLEKRIFDFSVRDHASLGEMTDTIDMVRGAKVSGARFAFLKGDGVKLARALMCYMIDYHTNLGDTEIAPPYLVKESALVGTGQFPNLKDDMFTVSSGESSNLYLIPTSEVPVTNYYASEILNEEDLPIRVVAFSSCFRAEAGAAGKDTRGLIRMHQFDKVEMVRFAKKEDSQDELAKMCARASDILKNLRLPHRLVQLCTGDLGFSSENTFDLEVYLPSQEAYREISSCSSFGDFQARRAKIRYKTKEGKIEYVNTLNGSGLPIGRTLVAIYENYQQKDGSILVPEVLRPYMNGKEVIGVAK